MPAGISTDGDSEVHCNNSSQSAGAMARTADDHQPADDIHHRELGLTRRIYSINRGVAVPKAHQRRGTEESDPDKAVPGISSLTATAARERIARIPVPRSIS